MAGGTDFSEVEAILLESQVFGQKKGPKLL